MKKETIETPYFENKNQIANLQMNVDHCQRLIQESLNEWNVICPVPLKLEELKSCLSPEPYRQPVPANVETLLRNKLIENKVVDFDGLLLNRETLKQMIVLPDMTAFIQSLEKFAGHIPSKIFQPNGDGVMWQYYTLVDGKVQVLLDDVEFHKNTFKEFARTPDEIQRLKSVLPVCAALNNFIKENPEVELYDVVNRNLIIYDEGEFFPCFNYINSGRI